MTTPENYPFPNTQLQQDLLAKATEVNQYARTHEGEYATYKATKMLGRMSTAYSGIPVFINGAPLVTPTPEGPAFGIGEITGHIAGFTYMNLSGQVEEWQPSEEGVVMQVSLPSYNGVDASDADWRLHILPEAMRRQDIEGFIVGVPVTEGQSILQLGEKEEAVSVASLLTPEQPVKEYSYQEYVKKIRALTGGKPSFNQADAAKAQAVEKLAADIALKCPYLGSLIAIDAEYIRIPKPDGTGYRVGSGTTVGVLRKFILDVYQDYQTKQWISDVMAVVYDPEVAKLVESGKIPVLEADHYPTTKIVPLSRPHVLVAEGEVKC